MFALAQKKDTRDIYIIVSPKTFVQNEKDP